MTDRKLLNVKIEIRNKDFYMLVDKPLKTCHYICIYHVTFMFLDSVKSDLSITMYGVRLLIISESKSDHF